ncbi:glycoside hydrolase family 31 protein [Fulvivirga sp. 29W222]|uniref:Glycoside hydrolase family 31 protein n=1 Tax=Fulvivirga marina TaxID=2494733 RepID=A0A937G2W2_9BACT|nr:glycoside hydrolase family 31 protein [Fulvivirga marina]MBL6448995.1 glycoside hydrolase family 31 protein [Fulvivirga marina]
MIVSQSSSKTNLNNSLDNLIQFEEKYNGIEGKTGSYQFRVLVYSANIIRVHITANEKFDEQSYAVIAKPEFEDFNLEDATNHLILKTSAINLKIDKHPVRFSFYDKHGNIINEDETFGTSWIGEQVTTYKKLQNGERFIGLGEKTGPLDRRGHGYQHWNTDSFAYDPESDPLYCSTPFYMGLHNKLAYGIFLDNSHKSHFNFGASNDRFSSFSADSGDMNYYFIYHDSVDEIIQSYTYLTGRMSVPPMWSIGYQQCRYSYYPDKEALTVAQTFRDKDIPADVIVFDIHYMEDYKIFTWDKVKFANPEKMIAQLRELGFHIVVMCDPGIKIEKGYEAYEDGKENDVFLKYPDGSYYSGAVWPGWCHFPDFTNPKTRVWWGDKLKGYVEMGVHGFWNDMNEIATWGQMMPELIEFDFEGSKGTTRKGRNLYGMQMAKSTFEGAKHHLNGKRPFNLTRAGFSGVQRYSAVWTGDNVANDEHMLVGVRLVNSMGLTGIAFAGYDVGGFVGNSSEHLFARWVQLGAFSPFFRGHSMINSRDSEPWAYGEEVEEISRNYIRLRYKLMPYIYSAFFEAAKTGTPIARSLAIDYSHDDMIYDERYHNQYMFGKNILVAPVESTKHLTKVYLPEGDWYEFFTDQHYHGKQEIIAECPIERLPLFVKASSIIPISPQASYNTTNLGDTLEFHIYAGKKAAIYTYYEDDGDSYEYEEGNYYKRTIQYDPKDSSIKISKVEGAFNSRFKNIKVCLHGFELAPISIDGKVIATETYDYQFVLPISNFDPIYTEPNTKLVVKDLKVLSIENSNDEVVIKW